MQSEHEPFIVSASSFFMNPRSIENLTETI